MLHDLKAAREWLENRRRVVRVSQVADALENSFQSDMHAGQLIGDLFCFPTNSASV
jgi:hypothetical protein